MYTFIVPVVMRSKGETEPKHFRQEAKDARSAVIAARKRFPREMVLTPKLESGIVARDEHRDNYAAAPAAFMTLNPHRYPGGLTFITEE